MAQSLTAKEAAEKRLTEKLEESGVAVLDVSVSVAKPVFTISVEGNLVPPEAFDVAEWFGAQKVESVRSSTWTPEVGDSMTVAFLEG